MSLPLGELAAIGTSLCWTVSAFSFEVAAKRIGPLAMNLVRVVLALSILSIVMLFVRGTPLPTDATAAQLGWLALSGLVGLVFGDLCLFRAYVEIGARRAMLVQTTAPIFTALMGWVLLGETPRPLAAVGTALVLLGVAWAIRERTAAATRATTVASLPPPVSSQAGALLGGNLGLGVVLALGGALGQAGGLVLSKLGMHGYHPIGATQIRMIAAAIGFGIVVSSLRAWRRVGEALHQRTAVGYTAVGALFGPTIGVSLSLVAITHTQAGIAAALMATQQVWMVVATLITGRERVGLAGIGGAVLAVSGVVLLVAA
jgi:drug/metabolite transporter (DMT)-like permease